MCQYISNICRATDLDHAKRLGFSSLDEGVNAIRAVRSICERAITARRNHRPEQFKAFVRSAWTVALWTGLKNK